MTGDLLSLKMLYLMRGDSLILLSVIGIFALFLTTSGERRRCLAPHMFMVPKHHMSPRSSMNKLILELLSHVESV